MRSRRGHVGGAVPRELADRLDDVVRACDAVLRHVADPTLPEELVHDAVRMRLVEVGEAVRSLPPSVTAGEPSIPWSRVASLGERLTRRYFDTTPAIVFGTARTDVPTLRDAVRRLRAAHCASAAGADPTG